MKWLPGVGVIRNVAWPGPAWQRTSPGEAAVSTLHLGARSLSPSLWLLDHFLCLMCVVSWARGRFPELFGWDFHVERHLKQPRNEGYIEAGKECISVLMVKKRYP